MLESHDLDAINWLERAVNAAPADQVALIRAARLHQDAVWIAEQEPELAWLMLVSALETGAGRWDRSAGSPIDQFRTSKPKLVEALDARCSDLIPFVAEEFSCLFGATRKFLAFTMKFFPDEPTLTDAPNVGSGSLDWARARAATNAAGSRSDAPANPVPNILERNPRREWKCTSPP